MSDGGFDLLVRGGTCVLPDGPRLADLGIRDGRIAAVGNLSGLAAAETLEARGLHVLPGVIDAQVHFREPGMEHKDDLASGSRAAVLGGVTAVLEMPNTIPPTVDRASLDDKVRRVQGRVWCDIGFAVGGTEENAGDLPALERVPGCVGVNLFLGSSTAAKALEGDAALGAVLAACRRRVSAHCEDEARLKERHALVAGGADPAAHALWRDVECAVGATRRFLAAARRAGKPVHVMNVSTGDEMPLIAQARDLATCDVTPLHLTFAGPEDYARLGTRLQTNPPVREARHREALWRAIADGTVDMVASDHSPHLKAEKAKPYPQSPSGGAGVQTLLPVMLTHLHAGRLDLARLVDLLAAGPARVYGIQSKGRLAPGFDADLVLVDLGAKRRIEDAWIVGPAGWTPFAGLEAHGWPVATVLRGQIVVREGATLGDPAGELPRFAGA